MGSSINDVPPTIFRFYVPPPLHLCHKCESPLLTASFLSSRKQYEYDTYTQKKRFTDKEIYQKSSYGSHVLSETYPPPSSIPKHLEFT